jgi:hypothetical protein
MKPFKKQKGGNQAAASGKSRYRFSDPMVSAETG